MSNKYAKFIKALRNERGFSQSFMAGKLGISRPSYIGVENGTREITLEEAEQLKDLFGTSFDGKIPKTKLAKLLYLADFSWFYKNLNSMSGMQYLRRAYGPVPDPYFRALDELEEEGKIKIDHKGDALLVSLSGSSPNQKLDKLSEKELELIKKIGAKWKEKNTRDIVDFTHEQLPYKLCSPDEVIPYELIIQQDPDYVY